MKIILKQNVNALGKAGDIVDVSDGHARNFLIPRGLAAEATDKNVNALAQEKKRILNHQEKERQKAQDLVSRLSGLVCTIPRRVGEQDKLFGSVSSKDIEAALKSQGFDIDRKSILMEDHIKSPGEYTVKIKIHSGITAEIKVLVISDK
ncbi:MAG: 50S ribosomal protein L9 [Syntrophus sp. SKADARSKE-3]|nr:50S ribosomal protein L9 [Syntrophus sp. SKADARSKE-3]